MSEQKGAERGVPVALDLWHHVAVQGILHLGRHHSLRKKHTAPSHFCSGSGSGLQMGSGAGSALWLPAPRYWLLQPWSRCLFRAEGTPPHGTRRRSRPGSNSTWGQAAAGTEESQRRVGGHSDTQSGQRYRKMPQENMNATCPRPTGRCSWKLDIRSP